MRTPRKGIYRIKSDDYMNKIELANKDQFTRISQPEQFFFTALATENNFRKVFVFQIVPRHCPLLRNLVLHTDNYRTHI